MADWLQHVTIATARNGTTTHTVTPSSGTVVAGTLFTPTAGRFLVCGVDAAVTSTTPSGWTLPTGGKASNNTELAVWYRTAAGSDSITTTHNQSNYPCVFDFYEFPAGTTFSGSVSAISVAPSAGAGPTLSGLTGTNWTAGSVGDDFNTTGTWTASWASGTKLVDTATPLATTDGYLYSLTAIDGDTAASRSYAATVPAPSGGVPTVERLVFAVKVPAVAAAANPRPTTVYRNAVHRSSNY